MKNNKGMTVISLIVYVIVLSILIGVVSTIMRYFYINTDETIVKNNTADKYSRVIAYITNDLNSRKNRYR